MSKMLQRMFIAVLNPIYEKRIKKIPLETRENYTKFVFIGFSVFFLLLFSQSFYHILFTHAQRHILASGMLLIATVFSMDSPLKTVRWNAWITIPYYVSALGLIITGIIHPIGSGYMTFGFMMLFVYTPFYLVWNNRKDYEKLFDMVADSILASGCIYALYCFAIFPELQEEIPGERFKGTILNANLFAMVGMAMACCAIYLIYRCRHYPMKVFLLSLGAFLGVAILILGQSRSSLIIVLFALLALIIFLAKNIKRVNASSKKIAVIAMLLLCALCIVLIVNSGNKEPEIREEQQTGIAERFSAKDKDLNTFTSGRIVIWTNYSKHLNLLGNDYNEADLNELTEGKVSHAHNNFLEYGYRCGIPVAVAFSVLELVAVVMSLWCLIYRKIRRGACLFVVVFANMYLVDSLLDIATIPFERYAPYFFYLLLCVLIDRKPNGKPKPNNEKTL